MADYKHDDKPGLAPAFDGTPSKYREYRRRALLFKRRMVLEKRGNVAALTLMGSLSGAAWEAVETIDESKLEMDDGGRSNTQEKLGQRLEAADVALQGAEAPYRQLLEIVNQLLTTLHGVEMPELLKDFEELERRKPAFQT